MPTNKILVIDDEEDFSNTIKMMLELAGDYEIVSACDGKEGIKKAHLVRPDLILLDIKMPEMDGLEALKILKGNPETMSIPVVMLTACDEDIYKLKACQLYDEDYLVKPVKTEILIDRVKKVMARRKISGK